ncbi:MAG: cryptochrome/photolyase family protein, partial [Rhodothermales bacterium]|nr:cryptochrome/photolyase family protein [Rhodothermales bacterium]
MPHTESVSLLLGIQSQIRDHVSTELPTRYLIPVFGDQLSRDSRLFDFADPDQDVFVMAEVRDEIERHRSHRQRVILFLSAMRHFRDDVEEKGFRVEYTQFDDSDPHPDLVSAIREAISDHTPSSLLLLEPGRFELEQDVRSLAR